MPGPWRAVYSHARSIADGVVVERRIIMSTSTEQKILIDSGDYPAREAVLRMREFSQRERVKRALIAWAGFWLLAALSVPILVAHWILVPAFLVAGPWVGWRRLNTLSVPDKVTGTCPAHQGEFMLELEPDERLPLWKPCPGCGAPLHLFAALIDNTRSKMSG